MRLLVDFYVDILFKYKNWFTLNKIVKCFLQDESLQTSLTSPMSSVIKRSKALRFYGLMGKRSGNLETYPCIT